MKAITANRLEDGRVVYRDAKGGWTQHFEDAARYSDDALINGLEFDRHAETLAVETFRRSLAIAGKNFLEDPHGATLIPNWNRVSSALPDFLDRLQEAVEEDNRMIREGSLIS